ncbi:prenyltransferase/squalene oxidase repeat-containing protein, partial [Patulibacter sp. NPDC049589]|uniref:prenyltransferase/squalene oxidase repeat-containing protein n=1 Tax=Patulibacter sp. NPDC049589 TaxID=3154731 RepID=UPI003419D8A2
PTGPLPLAGPTAAHAATAGTVDRAVRRLQAAQRSDGGFGAEVGAKASDAAASIWAGLALAAVGVHPGDQPAKGTTLLAYLRRQGSKVADTGDLARLVLVLRPAGEADSAAGRAALAALRTRQSTDGGFPDGPSGASRVEATAFAVLALHDGAGRADVAAGAAWLQSARGDEGWGATKGAVQRSRPTALALQALEATDTLAPDAPDVVAGQRFLLDRSNDDGGLGDRSGARSDPVSTAWATQGLKVTGIDPLSARQTTGALGDETVRTYLRARQRSDGGFGSTVRTAQVLPGLNGTPLPLTAVARGSDLASDEAPSDGRANAARGGGSGSGSDGLDDAKAGPGSQPSGGAGSGSGSGSGSGAGSTPSSTPPASSSSPPATQVPPVTSTPPTTTSAAPPASTTSATPPTTTTGPAPATDTAGGQQVGGTVVGAGSAPAAAGVATGGGGSGDDGVAIALAVVLVVVFGAGAQLERRRPRRVAP